MKCCAVIDTNVIISAIITKSENSATVRVINAVLSGVITPLYHKDILAEYDEVLHRPKFHFPEEKIRIRTCLHKICVRIFEHDFDEDKEKMRRRAVARQAFLTQSAIKFAEKTCAYACEDRFLLSMP